MKITSRMRAEMFLLAITIIWGSTFVLTKFILESASPFLYITIRFGIASILFTILFFNKIKTINYESVLKGSVLGILLFIGFATQTIGLQYTTASKSAFITGLMVVFTPLFQVLIEKKAPKLGNIIGVVLVAIGLYFLTSPQGSEFNFGDGLTLICAITFGLYIVYLNVYGKTCDPAHLSFMQFIITTLMAAIIIPFFEEPFLQLSPNFVLNLIYLSIMPTVLALYIMAKYQRFTTPTRSAIIYSAEPPIAAIFAFYVIGERLGLSGIGGGVLIFIGLLFSELSDLIFKKNSEYD